MSVTGTASGFRDGIRFAAGVLLGLLVRLWAATWRVSVQSSLAVEVAGPVPLVYAFWHGLQMPLVAARRRRRTAAMVSWSRDGQLQAGVMRALGVDVVRGSTSRGASLGLRRMVRALRCAADAAFAVDGPRGPLHCVQRGAAAAARLSGARLIPVGVAVSRRIVLRRAWDLFEIPLPLARVAVVLGPPVDAALAVREPHLLKAAIWVACGQARVQLSRRCGIAGSRPH